jgi:LmbE family N-acetylglucosaminyl deacetylase
MQLGSQATAGALPDNDLPAAAVRRALGIEPGATPPLTLILAAHPDDETIAVAGHLMRLASRVVVVHLTDGAPLDGRDAAAAGYTSRIAYAFARRQELMKALAIAGVASIHVVSLGIVDQQTSFAMADIARRVVSLVTTVRPSVVITHAYEGGHPDHDTAAFAARGAEQLLRRIGREVPALLEFPSYRADADGVAFGSFLADPGTHALDLPLSFEQSERRERMLAAFVTQQRVLAPFHGRTHETFRVAPSYDFQQPPHAGVLHYERFDWGMTGPRWRQLAGNALDALGLARERPAGGDDRARGIPCR